MSFCTQSALYHIPWTLKKYPKVTKTPQTRSHHKSSQKAPSTVTDKVPEKMPVLSAVEARICNPDEHSLHHYAVSGPHLNVHDAVYIMLMYD